MGFSWPDAIVCLGVTAMICGTVLAIGWMGARRR